ncbi:MAG TPA: penicillin-binding protein 2 [Candidatus Paceibacterota bacterium]|nr:penicillin-binding protein 2 [Verrucomicrobiota bacterium]HSA11009.1 penicillin-binding protein 2 [Candidatus Paceibacterota bacterium]
MPSPRDATEFRPLQYRRLGAIIIGVLAGFFLIFGRLFEIQIRRHPEFLAKARQFSQTARTLEARRGEIRDRNGITVALSTPVKAIYVTPGLCSNRLDQVAESLEPLLRIPAEELTNRVRACWERASRSNVEQQKALLLRRNVPVGEWRSITTALKRETYGFSEAKLSAGEPVALRKLRRQLLFARDEQRRVYPCGESLCQVLGFVSLDTTRAGLTGVRGIERGCNQFLAGKNGLCLSQQDVVGNELPAHRTRSELPADGNHVVLTIDLRLQQIVEQALADARVRYRARGASAIVMNPTTCEILALASCPGFAPENPGDSDPETWRNTVFTDMVEPGSTLKFILLAGALDQGLMTLESRIHCEQGRFVVNKVVVRDHAPHGLLTLLEAFIKSSNIAFAKIALALGPERVYGCLTNFGLAQRTGIAFAAETPGRIDPPHTWDTMTLTRAAFGQGMSMSQLQMATAMCAIANEGRLMRPYVVSRIESPQGQLLRQFQPQLVRAVVSPRTAQQVRQALKAVVSPEGTGALAALDRYTSGVKTGTAQKSNTNGYVAGRYYSSMIGCLPADTPRVVISIALDEPQNGYYAGTVVAPVFRSIAEQVAACLEIPADKVVRALPGKALARSTPAKASTARAATTQRSGAAPRTSKALASASRR